MLEVRDPADVRSVRARTEDGAVILVRENGKTLAEARGAAFALRFYPRIKTPAVRFAW